ncbi:hypothetical protein [Marinobacter sp.]|uniref:hypothetical protein n=1 Tax=Marinobacter sp. TaxID=50741 RepID=UPI003A95A06D
MLLDGVLRRLDFSRLKPNERARYISRICNVAEVIETRFPHVKQPEQIKLKHCLYFRNVWLADHTSSERTRGEHMRALGLLVVALGRDESWLGALKIKQASDKGGRPPKVGVRRSKKYNR